MTAEDYKILLSGLSILIVDDDPGVTDAMKSYLENYGADVVAAENGKNGLDAVRARSIDLVIMDLSMPGGSGLAWLEEYKKFQSDLPVAILTGHGDIDKASRAVKLGAIQYITKPCHPDQLVAVALRSKELKELRRENLRLREALEAARNAGEFIGESAPFREMEQRIEAAAACDAVVILHGERGGGKKTAAREIHRRSARRDRPFEVLGCAAMNREQAEARLFGYVSGAFPGADQDYRGALEAAGGGVLLLEEAAELDPRTQDRLLECLEAGAFTPIGALSPRPLLCRIMASTSLPLHAAQQDGRLRKGFWYRRQMIAVEVPPVRERAGDAEVLLDWFAERVAARTGTHPRRFSAEVKKHLSGYPWPGNVREIENMVEQTHLFTEGKIVRLENLPERYRHFNRSKEDLEFPTMEKVERDHIQKALNLSGGNISKAARLLDMDRNRLYRKIKGHELMRESEER